MKTNIITLERKKIVTHNGTKGIIGEMYAGGRIWDTIENYNKAILCDTVLYKVKYRNVGRMFEKYNGRQGMIDKEVPKIHHGRGMIEIEVPNRDAILFHIANYPEDLEGCIGMGKKDCGTWISSSTKAYCEFYPIVAEMLDKNEDVVFVISEEGL